MTYAVLCITSYLVRLYGEGERKQCPIGIYCVFNTTVPVSTISFNTRRVGRPNVRAASMNHYKTLVFSTRIPQLVSHSFILQLSTFTFALSKMHFAALIALSAVVPAVLSHPVLSDSDLITRDAGIEARSVVSDILQERAIEEG